ncbi:hypothetical protein chiPu_0006816 [Chiloscyllium punctatum]|uniref:Uncharacterized protein n=1 Tax=Chiloscyllium punctatum TaxID=137246 RepID=A0A401SDA5_CHIPU|nr:hypothetical protein [Chiloscyllium punctatum]
MSVLSQSPETKTEVQEGEGGFGVGPGDLEVRVEGVDELFNLRVGARGGTDTVIDVVAEMGDGASVFAEEELFRVSTKGQS